MMLALIKKDLRVFYVPLIGGVVLISCAYLSCASLYFFKSRPRRSDVTDVVEPAVVMGMVIVALLASAFGGSSFAAERREHSSDWLNMLPVTRGQIVASKVIAAFLSIIALLLFDFFPFVAVYGQHMFVRSDYIFRQVPWGQVWASIFAVFSVYLIGLTVACWVLFGLAWLFSTFLESAAISACLAIAIVFMTILTAEGIYHAFDWSHESILTMTFILLALTSTASFVAGTWYYVNRVQS